MSPRPVLLFDRSTGHDPEHEIPDKWKEPDMSGIAIVTVRLAGNNLDDARTLIRHAVSAAGEYEGYGIESATVTHFRADGDDTVWGQEPDVTASNLLTPPVVAEGPSAGDVLDRIYALQDTLADLASEVRAMRTDK